MGPEALIDLDALRHNLRVARDAAPASRVVAVIKANAYGHGMERAAAALADADMFGVARVEEGVRLREAGVAKPLLVLEGAFSDEELAAAAAHDLELAVAEPEQVERLQRADLPAPVRCWLKVDTGMHRLGIQRERAAAAFADLEAAPAVAADLRLMTHLACADDPDDPYTETQLHRFAPLARAFGIGTSIANSAGILAWSASHADWNRPGIMLYGSSPMAGGVPEDHGLRPVMTLRTRLIAVRRLEEGDPIGYGGTWRCPEAMPVGVAAIGYGDGYPRHAPSGTPVLVNGRRAPLVGRVSMDMVTIDLRGLPDARVGDPVVLWGEGLPADEIARAAGTISYELFCGVTARVRFREIASSLRSSQ